jgi:hypothetical protein
VTGLGFDTSWVWLLACKGIPLLQDLRRKEGPCAQARFPRARTNAGCSSVTSSANGRAVLNRATVPSVVSLS